MNKKIIIHIVVLIIILSIVTPTTIILGQSEQYDSSNDYNTELNLEAVTVNGELVWINGAGYGFVKKSNSEIFSIPDQDVSDLFQDDGDGDYIFIGTLDDIELEFSYDNLPWSMHVAALTSVNVGNKTGTVVRKYKGINYTIPDCMISYQVLTAYQEGVVKIFDPAYSITAPENSDCFVLVYYISETPYNNEVNIPVIVDKLVR